MTGHCGLLGDPPAVHLDPVQFPADLLVLINGNVPKKQPLCREFSLWQSSNEATRFRFCPVQSQMKTR